MPKVSDVFDRIKNGKKLTPALEYMNAVIKRVDKFISDSDPSGKKHDEVVAKMIEDIDADKDMFARQLAQMKFAMLVSRKWFEGATNFDDNVDTVKSQYGIGEDTP